jgi:DNA-binding winged helix-turn-helix (wHTH) protein
VSEVSLSYRNEEVAVITRQLRFGESVSVVGVSGMGKSNLFRYLQRTDVRQALCQTNWKNYLIVGVDSNALNAITEIAVYDLLLESIITELKRVRVTAEAAAQVARLHGAIKNTGSVVDSKRAFDQAMRLLLDPNPSWQVAILFDQFDQVYQLLPGHFFANLRFLRDEYKRRICYMTFTREELPRLCSTKECEEFYELAALNVMTLGPYNSADAQMLLDSIVGRYEQHWSDSLCRTVLELTKCHPGIMKATIVALLSGQLEPSELDQLKPAEIVVVRGINHECEKIFESLSKEEKTGLRKTLLGNSADVDADVLKRLNFKRLITNQTFALGPLFTEYVTKVAPRPSAATKIQAGPVRIDTAGEVWVNHNVIQPPLTKKELLLLGYFCLEPGRLRSKDEIISHVYSSEYEAGNSVSDEALNALVRRLRERIEPVAQGRCRIATVRGKGYRFEIPSEAW